MLKNIEDTLHKNCLVGISYFNADGALLKQNILAGKVVSLDKEAGITLALISDDATKKAAHFVLPSNLSCWFNAPQGDFHTSHNMKITNPDYLVTWDVYQTKKNEPIEEGIIDASQSGGFESPKEGEQQWWEWQPRNVPPNVG